MEENTIISTDPTSVPTTSPTIDIPFTEQSTEQKIETVNNTIDTIQSIYSSAMSLKASDFKNTWYFIAIFVSIYSIFKQFWLESIVSHFTWPENYMLIAWVFAHITHRFIKANPE